MDDRVTIPRIPTPSARRWFVAACVGAVIAVVVALRDQPISWWGFVLGIIALGFVPLFVWSEHRSLDPSTGTFHYRRLVVRQRSATLGPDLPIEMTDSGNGYVQLCLGSFPRRILVPLLLINQYDRGSQPPEILQLLADQLDRFAPHHRPLAARLRQQAGYVTDRARPLDRSPLAESLGSHSAMPLPFRRQTYAGAKRPRRGRRD
jgi:hypothetical protein